MSYKDKPSTERAYCTDDVNIDETNASQHKSLTKLDLNKQTDFNKGSTESKLPKTFLNIDTLVDPNVYQKSSCPKPNKSNDQVEIQSKLGKKEDAKKAKPVLDLDLLVDENVNYNKASVAKSKYDDDVNIKETTESQTKSTEIGYKKNKKVLRDIIDVDDLINEDIGYENLNKSKVKTCLADLFLEESPVKLNTTKRVQFIGEEESDIEISQHNTPVLKNKAVTKPASRNLSKNKYDVDDILVGEVDVLKETSKTKSPNSAKKRIDVDTLLNEEKLDNERNTEAKKKNIEVLTLSASSLSLDENDMSESEAKNEDLTIDHVKFDGKKASRSLINMIDLDSECGESSHKANKSVFYSGNKIGGTEWLKEVSKLNETSINHNESLVNDPSSLITSNPYSDSADGKKRKSKYIK